MDRFLAVAELPDPVGKWSGDDDIGSWVRVHLKQLGEMFDDEGLARLRGRCPRHPAVELYDVLFRIEGSGGMVRWPDEFESVAAVGTVGLDFSTWAPRPPYDDFWSFLDAETRAWTLGVLAQPDQFEDAMAELFTWGWLRSEGFKARRVNDAGASDIVLDDEDPWRCEVKRIHVGTPQGRVARIVTKANQQIKKTDPDSAGTLFVSLARAPTRAAFDDRIPNDVEPYVAAVRDALKVHHRSVAQVVVMWDDVMIVGDPPDPVLYAFRRRSLVVGHQAARRRPKYPSEALSVGRSATVWIRWSPRGAGAGGGDQPALKALTAADVEVTQLFRQENEVAVGIRARHAVEAFREPDAVSRFGVGGIDVWLATRRIELGPSPYTLLLLACRLPGQQVIQIVAGFRLYRDQLGPTELWREPQAAFETLVERYGLQVRVGELVGRFVPAAVVERDQVIEGEDGEKGFFVSAFTRLLDDGRVEYAWVFAIDTAAYRAAARARRS